MTRSRISMVVAAAGLALVGLLAAVLFTPSKDGPSEEQTATKDTDTVKPIEAAQPNNPLYDWQKPAITPPPATVQAPAPTTPAAPAPVVPKPETTPAPAPKTGMIDYKIQPGDMISKLASKYGCSTSDIYKANDGLDASNAHKVRVGQTIRIPVGGDTTVVEAESSSAAGNSGSDYRPRRVITAAPGDNMFQLAEEHYGSKYLFRLIKDANPDLPWGDKLRGGEQVVLPEHGTAPAGSGSKVASAKAPAETVERSSLIPSRK